MVELKNEQLTILVSEKGAELQSIKDANGKEYLWQADPKYWPRRSPILFPIVCSVNNETYRIDGKEYHLPRHGFARDAEFKLISQSERKVTLALESSEETKKVYPYDFTLSVSYVLDGNKIGVIWHVHNTDTREIHFQIGGHPAFNIPGMKAGENQYGRIRLDNQEPMDALHSYLDGSLDMDEVPFIEADNGIMEFSNNTGATTPSKSTSASSTAPSSLVLTTSQKSPSPSARPSSLSGAPTTSKLLLSALSLGTASATLAVSLGNSRKSP